MLPLAIPQHRAEVGDPLDRFYTPDPLADAVVSWVLGVVGPQLWLSAVSRALRVAEPSVGGGAFVRALRRQTNARIWGCDIDPNAEGLALLEADPRDYGVVGDWEQIASQAMPVDLILGNLPFSLWMPHVLVAREEIPDAWTASILPVEYVCTVEGDAFLSRHTPRYMRPIVGRPWPKSVRGTAVYVWPPVDQPAPTTDLVLPGISV